MSEIKLLPCPFCGGEAELIGHYIKGVPNDFQYFVRCKKCKARPQQFYTFKKKEKAVEAWNTRRPMELIVDRLEKELYLADKEKERSAKENPLQFDSAKGYANGVAVAIEIVKEEGGEFVLNGSKANNDGG